ncbi:MAG: trypsin-like peptidase domain-containing protein [Elusimicrobia bacterium]|nr:trypsin-like peptidase domain-containing protein [Elusimicrobiota bacterium]
MSAWLALALALGGRAAAADADLQDRILLARRAVLPKTVYIHVVARDYDEGKAKRALWTGSGVIISSDGYVATNAHVLEQAQRVRVMLSDSRAYEGRVVGTDPDTDLGLLRLDLPAGQGPLPAAAFAEPGALAAGDFVLAVGSPFGLSRSVSFGIVNNPAQSLGDEGLYNWIQTDAAINPGNSGGPLVDLEGRVVGINTLGIGGAGLGFAIPSDVAQDILARLKSGGRVARSSLGLSLQALRDFDRDSYAPGERGVLVVGAEPGSPAAAAGLRPGDFLVSVNGQALGALYPEDLPAVRRRLADLPAGRPAALAALRGGRLLELTAVPKPRAPAAPSQEQFDAEEWMLTAKAVREDEESLEGYLRPGGCYVLGVAERGNAARSGLKSQDIILAVDGTAVGSLAELRQAYWRSLAKPAAERLILVSVLRHGRPFQVALDYSHSKASQETP